MIIVLFNAAACGGKAVSPTPTPTAISTLVSFTSLPWLRVAYPAGWRETAPGRYEGADGYAWLELRSSNGARPEAVCFGEANRDKPKAYGAYPEIRDLELEGQPACLILPSDDQPAGRQQESLSLLWVPASFRTDTLLALHADRAHILAITESLAFNRPLPAQPPSACDFSVAAAAPRTNRVGGLRIDEFPIARSATATGAICSPEQEAKNFHQRVEVGAPFERAEAVRLKQYGDERMGRLNASLAPFGFRVEAYDQKLFRVLRHETVVRSEMSWIGPLTLSANGQVFYLPVVDSYAGTAVLIRPDGVHVQEGMDLLAFDLVFPVYAGPDRISLSYEYRHIARAAGSPSLLQILKNDFVIDTLSVSGSTPASGPVRGLWSWKNHWILELPGVALEDGASLNERLGYPEIFNWRLIKDLPFYFYRKDGLVHAVYHDQGLPGAYDEVLSEPQWTEKVLVQMHAYESGLVFFARRGSTWYYVVIEAE